MDNEKQLEDIYGKPESQLVTFTDSKCPHVFYRRNASEFGCKNCPSVWIDNGMIFTS